MFDVGWTEMLVIAIVMIVVVGPKDLPQMLRTMGRMAAKLRNMAGDFQKQFNDALKDAELDDVKKSVDSLRSLNPMTEIRKQLNPFEQAAADVRSGIETAMAPKPAPDPSTPPATEPQPAEPLKNGAADLPGSAGPENMPATPDLGAASTPKVKKAVKAKTAKPASAASASSARKTTAKRPAGAETPVKAKAVAAKPAGKPARVAKPAAAPKKAVVTKTRTARAAK